MRVSLPLYWYKKTPYVLHTRLNTEPKVWRLGRGWTWLQTMDDQKKADTVWAKRIRRKTPWDHTDQAAMAERAKRKAYFVDKQWHSNLGDRIKS